MDQGRDQVFSKSKAEPTLGGKCQHPAGTIKGIVFPETGAFIDMRDRNFISWQIHKAP
jgi:hypothetical protein